MSKFELVDNVPQNAVIKVVGIGGGGGNAVTHMIENKVEGVDFMCANTDAQALADIGSKTVLQLGGTVTKGLGAGADPEVGRQAAIEDRDRIAESLEGADMVFITAGMGGGTGTGGAPVVAEIAKDMGILTVAVVTRPFPFEGKKRLRVAEKGMAELEAHVDSLITIPNEKLLEVLGADTGLLEAFAAANDVLLGAVQGIADLIMRPGKINVDFADVRTVMSEMGKAMMGTGIARGQGSARVAAEQAIHSKLLEDVNLQGARGILVNITAGLNLTLGEFTEVGDTIEEFASENATVVIGTVIDPDLTDEIRVTVVATGLADENVDVPQDPGLSLVDSEQAAAPVAGKSGRVDYGEFDTPAYARDGKTPAPAGIQEPVVERSMPSSQQMPQMAAGGEPAGAIAEDKPKLLNIPAFVRKQVN